MNDTLAVETETPGTSVTQVDRRSDKTSEPLPETKKGIIEHLRELQELRDKDTITQREYEQLRSQKIEQLLAVPAEGKTSEASPDEKKKDLMKRLEELEQLRDQGTITQKEYEQLRSKTIEQF
jgi:ribosomal protein L19E